MFKKILIANRGDIGLTRSEAGAAKPERVPRAARAGDLDAVEA